MNKLQKAYNILSKKKTRDEFKAMKEMFYNAQKLEEEGRITNLPYESSLTVDTFWDLGVNDTTAIWFIQQVGTEIRVIDYIKLKNHD